MLRIIINAESNSAYNKILFFEETEHEIYAVKMYIHTYINIYISHKYMIYIYVYIYEIITLYTLSLYNIIGQLYPKKTGKNK